MKFYKFIRLFKDEDFNYIGDLAKDIDREESKIPNTYKAWESYLSSKGACEGAREALKTAWKAYRIIIIGASKK